MADLLRNLRVAPLFLGIAGYHSGLPLVVPMGSALPIAIGDRRSGHPIARYGPSKSRVWDFSPFSACGRSHRLGTIGGNGRLFGRSRLNLWVETPGGGDGSHRGSVRTCFMRR